MNLIAYSIFYIMLMIINIVVVHHQFRARLNKLRKDLAFERRCYTNLIKRSEEQATKIRSLTKQLDDQLGTPCEQIRHQQELEGRYTERELEIAYCVGLLGQQDITIDKLSEDLNAAPDKLKQLKTMILQLRQDGKSNKGS